MDNKEKKNEELNQEELNQKELNQGEMDKVSGGWPNAVPPIGNADITKEKAYVW